MLCLYAKAVTNARDAKIFQTSWMYDQWDLYILYMQGKTPSAQ